MYCAVAFVSPKCCNFYRKLSSLKVVWHMHTVIIYCRYYHNAHSGSTVWDCPIDLSYLEKPPEHKLQNQQQQNQQQNQQQLHKPTIKVFAPSISLAALALDSTWKPLKKTLLHAGDGKTWPNPGDKVSVHYTGCVCLHVHSNK